MRIPKRTKLPPKEPRSESDVVAAVLRYLTDDLGLLAWRANQIPVMGRTFQGLAGVADILGVLPTFIEGDSPMHAPGLADRTIGRLLAIECKMPKTDKTAAGSLRPEQAAFIDRVNASGGLAFVARSVDDVRRALQAEGVVT